MTHHYKHQWTRPDIRELARIRELDAKLTRLIVEAPVTLKEHYKVKQHENRLLYQELTNRPFLNPEDYDMGAI